MTRGMAMVAAFTVAAVALPGCDRLGPSVTNCDRTVVDVAPVRASTLDQLRVTARLRTKDGDRPVPGRTLRFSLEEKKGSGGYPTEVDTDANGEAVFALGEQARQDTFVRSDLAKAKVLHVRYRNPDEITEGGQSTPPRGFCSSEAWVDFEYTGPLP